MDFKENKNIVLLTGAILLAAAVIVFLASPTRRAGIFQKSQVNPEIQKIETQSSSDDINSIEKDLNDTDLNNIDKELTDIDNELNSGN
jgi:uncharacterized protein (DUF3084 family)